MNNIIKEKLFLHFKSQIKLLGFLFLCNLTYKTVRNSMVECMKLSLYAPCLLNKTSPTLKFR